MPQEYLGHAACRQMGCRPTESWTLLDWQLEVVRNTWRHFNSSRCLCYGSWKDPQSPATSRCVVVFASPFTVTTAEHFKNVGLYIIPQIWTWSWPLVQCTVKSKSKYFEYPDISLLQRGNRKWRASYFTGSLQNPYLPHAAIVNAMEAIR